MMRTFSAAARAAWLTLATAAVAAPQTQTTVEVAGAVFDAKSRPLAGATVTLARPGRAPLVVATDERGAYVLRFDADPRVRDVLYGVRVEAGAGRAAQRPLLLLSGRQPGPKERVERDNVMVVKAATALEVQVSANGAPAARAGVLLAGSFGGAPFPIAEAVADSGGRIAFGDLPEGRYTLRAVDAAGRCAEREIELPRQEPRPVELELEAGRDLQVRVVDAGTGSPVPGVELRVVRTRKRMMPLGDDLVWLGPAPIATDPSGRARLAGLPPGEAVEVRARGDLDAERLGEGAAEVAPDASDVEVELEPVEVRNLEDVLKASRSRREPETGPRTLALTARDETGKPVAGLRLRRPGSDDGALTGDDGVAVLRGLPAKAFVLAEVVDPEHRDSALAMTNFDLTAADASWELRVGGWRQVVLHVRIDGEARLPAGAAIITWRGTLGDVAKDEAAGIIRFTIRPDDPAGTVRAALDSATHARAQFEFEPGPPGGTVERAVELGRPSTLKVTVIPPATGKHFFQLQRFDAERSEWRWMDTIGRGILDPAGPQVVENLPAGRYRAGDGISGYVGAAIDLPQADELVQATLDLSPLTLVRGTVRGPAGADLAQARIRVDCPVLARSMFALEEFPETEGWRVLEDGAFEGTLPQGHEATLRVHHPNLPAVAGRDAVTWDGSSAAPLVFELANGSFAALELDRALDFGQRPNRAATVLLFRGEPRGEPVSRHLAAVEGTRLRFGGFEPGTYTVWIDTPPFAPLVLFDLALAEGDRDYGRHAVDPGATLRLKLAGTGGSARRAVMVAAHAVGDGGAPVYHRVQHEVPCEPDGLFSGLGAGTFDVEVSIPGSGQSAIRRRVDSKGSGEIVLEVPF